MPIGIKNAKSLRTSTMLLVSCAACALAWWWWIARTATGNERLNPLLSYLAGVLNFPGWLVVMIFDPRESPMLPATRLTDNSFQY
jgi:hypothetical protein